MDDSSTNGTLESGTVDLHLDVDSRDRPLEFAIPGVRDARLLTDPVWVRNFGSLKPAVSVETWKFPTPPGDPQPSAPGKPTAAVESATEKIRRALKVKLIPSKETLQLKERLLYVLQPPIDNMFAGKQVSVPFAPYPYQLEGIAFLMPRHSALLADEMGLGKTIQTILAVRLMLQAGLLQRILLVCPKPLVFNWCRELKSWASDLPFEIVGGSSDSRRAAWSVSNAPLKIVNYEVLTRDAEIVKEVPYPFDLVILDEAQRIKNRDSKTARAVCDLPRSRSWALTGTPIENSTEDLVNLFAFVDADRVPQDTPAKQLSQLTADCILRRTKDDVLTDLPGKTITDAVLELSTAQREAYDRAENEGVIELDEMGDTISIQHVFELVMRLKQICNFEPCTGESCKLERLQADIEEVAANGRKALVFSQWVEPLDKIADALRPYGPLLYHGRIPQRDRIAVLDRFKSDNDSHVLLMSYGTGSVGLNLQFCNYVFLFDRWWNPAVEDQAINRAHRIGQKEPVFVTRFITEGTIEGRIADILDRKRQLFNDLLARNEPPPRMGLSEDDIFSLFHIRSRPKRMAS